MSVDFICFVGARCFVMPWAAVQPEWLKGHGGAVGEGVFVPDRTEVGRSS